MQNIWENLSFLYMKTNAEYIPTSLYLHQIGKKKEKKTSLSETIVTSTARNGLKL